MLVLHYEGGDDSDNVLLLTARELGHILKNFAQLTGWFAADLLHHCTPTINTQQIRNSNSQGVGQLVQQIRARRLVAQLPKEPKNRGQACNSAIMGEEVRAKR